MLQKLSLQNFKSFSKEQEIEFSPITLIYGPNSSGKSTIIQSLMLLKQSILSGDNDGELISTGGNILLGDYPSFVNNHDFSKNIEFGLQYSLNQDAKEYLGITAKNILFGNGDLRSLDISYSYDKESTIASVDRFSFGCRRRMPMFTVSQYRRGGYRFINSEDYKYHIIKKSKTEEVTADMVNRLDSTFSSNLGTTGLINLPLMCLNSNLEEVNSYSQRVSGDIVELFSSFRYLGPLRSSPKRFYAKGFEEAKSGRGKNNLGVELERQGIEVMDKINKRLFDFNIPYKLSVEDLGNNITGKLVALELEDLRSGAKITPADVGFGIGQVLPIILEAEVSKNKIICVEQPEIHLHPKLQAHMADLFIDSVSKNNGSNQWVIETHSEALLLRLQRRIRNGDIPKEMVSIHYVDVGDDGAVVTNIPLDRNGDFTVHWPNGFFEERLEEIMG